MDTMKNLIKAAYRQPEVSVEWERRVAMLAIARTETERLARQARWAMIGAAACLVGLAMTLPVEAIANGIATTIRTL